MATIRKRGQSYQIRVSCGYDTKGAHKEQTLTWKPEKGMTERQIQKDLNRVAVMFEEACMRDFKSSAIKFEQIAEEWFEEYAHLNLRSTTYERMRQLTKRVYPAIGHLRIDKITGRQLQAFVNSLAKEGANEKTGAPLAPKTIRHNLSFISDVFSYAVKIDLVSDNPCSKVSIPKGEIKEKQIYSQEEMELLLTKIADKPIKYRAFFYLIAYSGFRRSEMLGLEWKDIDFSTNMVTINRTSLYSKSQGGTYTETPKTETSYRTLKLPDEVIGTILHWRDLQDKQRTKVGSKWQETDRIFTKWNGLPLDGTAPGYFFKQFCERTGMRYVCNHSFRHFYTTVLISNGIDVKTVQSCLGHSTPTTTLQIYAHTFQAAQVRAMDTVANAIRLNSSGQ